MANVFLGKASVMWNNLHLCCQLGPFFVELYVDWRNRWFHDPETSLQAHLLPPSSLMITGFINLLRSYREQFQNHGPSCMKNPSIFSIMYFSFSENMNVMVRKNCKIGSKMRLFPIILSLCCRDFIIFSLLWLVLSHHLEEKLKYEKKNIGR